MLNPMIIKLGQAVSLDEADRRRLLDLCVRPRRVPARVDLIRENDEPDKVHLVLDGFACRYKSLDDGTRAIVAYFVPGDFCDLHVAILGRMDHSIATLAPCTVVEIPRATIREVMKDRPRIAQAFWWATLVDEAILREWLVGVGRRRAEQRLAHLLCELLIRLRVAQRGGEWSFELPLTQQELADTLGLSTVHVNRVLQQLREKGLISMRGGLVRIHDWPRLEEFAGFDANYLHLDDGQPEMRNAALTA